MGARGGPSKGGGEASGSPVLIQHPRSSQTVGPVEGAGPDQAAAAKPHKPLNARSDTNIELEIHGSSENDGVLKADTEVRIAATVPETQSRETRPKAWSQLCHFMTTLICALAQSKPTYPSTTPPLPSPSLTLAQAWKRAQLGLEAEVVFVYPLPDTEKPKLEARPSEFQIGGQSDVRRAGARMLRGRSLYRLVPCMAAGLPEQGGAEGRRLPCVPHRAAPAAG